MVYCGIPSKACQRCRLRRIKVKTRQWPTRLSSNPSTNHSQCDLVQPSCNQCRRADRVCAGYRNQLDLAFRDQSAIVASKVQQAFPNAPQCFKRATRTRHKAESSEYVGYVAALAQPIQVPYVDQAAQYFFKVYDSEAAESVKSIHKYVPYLYDGCRDSALSSVISALGFAGLSRYGNVPKMTSLATSNYYTALRRIRTDLQDPVAAKTDQTLLSVYLLGLYEVRNILWDSDRWSADIMLDKHMQHSSIDESLVQSC